MSLLKFFASVWGVSDALNDEERAEKRKAYEPKIAALQQEMETRKSEILTLEKQLETTISPSEKSQLETTLELHQRKVRDLEKLIHVYQNM